MPVSLSTPKQEPSRQGFFAGEKYLTLKILRIQFCYWMHSLPELWVSISSIRNWRFHLNSLHTKKQTAHCLNQFVGFSSLSSQMAMSFKQFKEALLQIINYWQAMQTTFSSLCNKRKPHPTLWLKMLLQ